MSRCLKWVLSLGNCNTELQETLISWRFYLTKYFVVEKKSNYFKIWFNSKECFPFGEKKNLYLLRPNCIINSVLFLYLNWQIHKPKYISFYFNTFSKVLKTKMSNNTFSPNFWIITKLGWLWTQWEKNDVCVPSIGSTVLHWGLGTQSLPNGAQILMSLFDFMISSIEKLLVVFR